MKFYIETLNEYIELPVVHQCKFTPKQSQCEDYQFGEAISNEIFYNKYHNNFLISNDEYCSIINFCPYCGMNFKEDV